MEGHSACRPAEFINLYTPTRLIDVAPLDGSQKPCLYVPANISMTPGEKALAPPTSLVFERGLQYVALSYCWGEGESLVTTLSNLSSRIFGIEWDAILKTIQDAILVTRGLGLRYIWVDSLCILQGPGGDWTTESQKMADVYVGAILTISTALSPHVGYGLRRRLGDHPAFSQPPLGHESLYRRGWTLQERMLSQHLLIFGSDQLYRQCSTYKRGKNGIKILTPLCYRLSHDSSDDDWYRVVRDYTGRNLTCEGDKLPALAGLAITELHRRATSQVCGESPSSPI
jgi:hypothetical protein